MSDKNSITQPLKPAEKFDLANKNFKKVYRSRFDSKIGKKYQYLHNWTLQKSIYLLNDISAYKGNKKMYRRGAIVSVDLGVNVGTELSGNHFAIVLNKNDSPKNDKLTIIPLTSHFHPHTVKLDNTIRDSSIANFKLKFCIQGALLYALEVIKSKAINDIRHKLDSNTVNFAENTLEDFKKISEPLYDYSKKHITNYNDAINFLIANSNFYKSNEDIPKLNNILGTSYTEKLQKDLILFQNVLKKYTSFNKTTYAKVIDITTISKTRLRKINQFDPIGDIRVSDNILDTIDEEIKSLFLH